MNEEQLTCDQEITNLASLLNAAHLIAEESAWRFQGLVARYPDTFPLESLPPELASTSEEETCQITADVASG
jgi:hypothetical protein